MKKLIPVISVAALMGLPFSMMMTVIVTPHAAKAGLYGLAEAQMVNLTLSGLQSPIQVPGRGETDATGLGQVDFHSDPFDPAQAEAGPGPFPPENTFVPQTPGLGAYVRADALISKSSVQSISEFNIPAMKNSESGRATSTSSLVFTGTIDANQVVIVSFNAAITTSAILDNVPSGSGVSNTHSSLQFTIFQPGLAFPNILDWIPGVPILPGGPDYEAGPEITVLSETVPFATNVNTAPFDETGLFSISFTSNTAIGYIADFQLQTALDGFVCGQHT